MIAILVISGLVFLGTFLLMFGILDAFWGGH